MESVRKQLSKTNQIIVFIGFLLSMTSLYVDLSKQSGSHSFQLLFSSFYILMTITIFGIMSLLYYMLSKKCTFSLEILEYVLLPLSTLMMIDVQNNWENEDSNVVEESISLIFTVIIGSICIIKIILVNQLFPENPNYQILVMNLKCRTIRVIKLILLPYLANLIPTQTTLHICVLIINFIQFSIVYTELNFAKPSLEIAAMIGSLSYFSNFFFLFHGFTDYNLYGFLQIGIIFIFLFLRQPFIEILEIRYLKKIDNFKGTFSDSDQCSNEKRIILFESLSVLLHQTRGNREVQWSLQFEKAIKQIYIQLVWEKREEIQSHFNINTSADIYNESMMASYSSMNKSAMKDEEYHYKIGRILAIEQFQKGTNTKKPIFCELLSLLVNLLYNKKPNKCDVTIQFFIQYSCHISSANVMKALLFYYREKQIKNQNFFKKLRNVKLYTYLKFFQTHHSLKPTQQSEMIIFEEYLSQLKQQIKKACKNEAKLIQQMAKPMIDLSIYEKKLSERWENKQKILKLIEKSFNNWRYLLFQEFVYIYLLFKIIFCKSIAITQEEVQQKFISPKKQSFMIQKINQKQDQALLMCSGLKTDELELGSIILYNTPFKKKFNFSSQLVSKRSLTIGILIPEDKGRRLHQEMIEKYSKFNFQPQNSKDHAEYQCYLKTNLQNQFFCLLKLYQISVKIFYGHQDNILYISKLKEKQQNLYFLKNQYHKLLSDPVNSRASRLSKIYPQIKNVEQLGQILQLIEAQQEKLQILNYKTNEDTLKSKESIFPQKNTQRIILTEQKLLQGKNDKFVQVQKNIWGNSFGSKRITYLLYLSMLIIVISIGLNYNIIFYGQSLEKQSVDVVQTSIKNIQAIHGFQMSFAFSLMMIREASMSNITDKMCDNSAEIQSLINFSNQLNNEFLSQKFKIFFDQFLSVTPNKAQILNIFKQRQYHFADFHHESLQSDYLNYVFQANSMLIEYSSQDFNYLSGDQLSWFKQVVGELFNTGLIQDKSSVIASIYTELENIINQNKKEMLYSFYFQVGALCLAMITLIVLMVKIYYDFTGYFYLLENMDQAYFYNRINEVKFIEKEIQAMQSKKIKQCSIQDERTVKIKSKGIKNQQNTFSLDQFQKLAEQNSQQNIKIQLNNKKDQISHILRLLYSKKVTLVIIILIFGGMIGVSFMHLQIEYDYQTTIWQLFDLFISRKLEQESLTGLLASSWIKYFQNQQYLSQQNNERKFNKHQSVILNSESNQATISLFDEKFTKQTMYSNFCLELEPEIQRDCLNQGFQFGSFTQFIPALWKQQKMTWIQLQKGNILEAEEGLCQSTKLLYKYAKPYYGIFGFKMLENEITKHQNLTNVQISLYIFTLALVAFFFTLELFRIYRSFTKIIRFEVMTFDTPSDLYKNQDFRPYINRIYNSKGNN